MPEFPSPADAHRLTPHSLHSKDMSHKFRRLCVFGHNTNNLHLRSNYLEFVLHVTVSDSLLWKRPMCACFGKINGNI
jgi:hypothetical protein